MGVIDGDYYGNPNEGHIFAQMQKYHRPRGCTGSGLHCAGCFRTIFVADGDVADGVRTGGLVCIKWDKVIFVRHGEPDYHELEDRSYTGWSDLRRIWEEDGRLRTLPASFTAFSWFSSVSSATTRALKRHLMWLLVPLAFLESGAFATRMAGLSNGKREWKAEACFRKIMVPCSPSSPIQYETAGEMKACRWWLWASIEITRQ